MENTQVVTWQVEEQWERHRKTRGVGSALSATGRGSHQSLGKQQPSVLQSPPRSGEWEVSQFEIKVGPSHKRTPDKTRLHSLSLPCPPSLSRSYIRPSLSVHPALAHSLSPTITMFTSHFAQPSSDVAIEEMSAQLAVYSRTLFQFTLRLWSESRKRAEELQKMEESASSRPSQVRTGSVRSIPEVDANTPQ